MDQKFMWRAVTTQKNIHVIFCREEKRSNHQPAIKIQQHKSLVAYTEISSLIQKFRIDAC